MEIIFAKDGVVISDLTKHTAIDLSYAEMASITMQFIQKMWTQEIHTDKYGVVTLQRIKEYNGSSYPFCVIDSKEIPRQIKPEEIISVGFKEVKE